MVMGPPQSIPIKIPR